MRWSHHKSHHRLKLSNCDGGISFVTVMPCSMWASLWYDLWLTLWYDLWLTNLQLYWLLTVYTLCWHWNFVVPSSFWVMWFPWFWIVLGVNKSSDVVNEKSCCPKTCNLVQIWSMHLAAGLGLLGCKLYQENAARLESQSGWLSFQCFGCHSVSDLS